MNALLQNLVESLREELKQYGELLALLDLQQDQVVRPLAATLVETVSDINAQGEAIHLARCEREQVRPFIVVAYDAERRPLLLMPLALGQRHGFRTVAFMGGMGRNR